MKKIMEYRVTHDWNPEFEYVATAFEAADSINLPHEDYPKRTRITEEMIMYFQEYKEITQQDILLMHSQVMFGTNHRGRYRNLEVTVGNHVPPKHYVIENLITEILPLKRDVTDLELIEWYIAFETLHPFEDGNGRVGGVVLSALSFDGTKYLAPKPPKLYKEELDWAIRSIK